MLGSISAAWRDIFALVNVLAVHVLHRNIFGRLDDRETVRDGCTDRQSGSASVVSSAEKASRGEIGRTKQVFIAQLGGTRVLAVCCRDVTETNSYEDGKKDAATPADDRTTRLWSSALSLMQRRSWRRRWRTRH